MTFYGEAVDQDGRPLKGVNFEFEVEAIPPGWTFETRGKPHIYSLRPTHSGADGRFEFSFTGHVLRMKVATIDGFRHLHDQSGNNSGFNLGYMITDWGETVFQSSPDNPAVYVFVKDGVTQVAALPCGGGSERRAKAWIPNRSAWPKYPSLKDVVQKQATTSPK